jgi:hypothetical protein
MVFFPKTGERSSLRRKLSIDVSVVVTHSALFSELSVMTFVDDTQTMSKLLLV